MKKFREFTSLSLASLLLLAAANFSYGQGNFEGVELSIMPVSGNVYMIQRPGGGGNIGVQVGPDGVLLVDSLFAPLAEKLPENGVRQKVSSALSAESQAVRVLALGEIASLTGALLDELEIGALEENESLPCLRIGGKTTQDLLSFSHHGAYVMCTFYAHGLQFDPDHSAAARGWV